MEEKLTTLSPPNPRLHIMIRRTIFLAVLWSETDFFRVFCAHTIWKVAYSAETAQRR